MKKLTDQEVSEIKHKSAVGVMRKVLAVQYGVDPKTITRITKDVDKPEMRGRHNISKAKHYYSFKEDYEW